MSVEKLSSLVKNQFPAFFREEGENFINFVKAYYEYLEQNGKLNDSIRNLKSYRDISETTDEYIEYFRKDLLPSIPTDILTDKKLLAKYIKYFNQSRGTIASYKLLFRAIYNEDVEVYYPADSILKVSDGDWRIDRYLVTSYDSRLYDFIGKTIKGTDSQSEALVEDVVKRVVKGRDLMQVIVSNIKGTFKHLEPITLKDGSVTFAPIIEAGIRTATIETPGGFYSRGDVVRIFSDQVGEFGKVVVTDTVDLGGSLTFSLRDGGSGFVATTASENPTTIQLIGGDGSEEASFIIQPDDIVDTFAISINTNFIYANNIFGTLAPIINGIKMNNFANTPLSCPNYGFPEDSEPVTSGVNFHDNINAVLRIANTKTIAVNSSLFGQTSQANAKVTAIISPTAGNAYLRVDGYRNFTAAENIKIATASGTTVGTCTSYTGNTVGYHVVQVGNTAGYTISVNDELVGKVSGAYGVVKSIVATSAGGYTGNNDIYVLYDGVNDTSTTSDTVTNSISGDFTAIMYCEIDDLSNGNDITLMCKETTSSDRCFYIQISPSGKMRITVSTNGSSTTSINSSGLLYAYGIEDKKGFWFKVDYDSNVSGTSKNASFYYSNDSKNVNPDSVNWNLMTSNTVATTGALFDSTGPIIVGGRYDGVSQPFSGKIYRAVLKNGIGGTTVSDFNPKFWTSGTTFTVPSTSETWTLNNGAKVVNNTTRTLLTLRATSNATANMTSQFNTGPMKPFLENEGVRKVGSGTVVGNVVFTTANSIVENIYTRLDHSLLFTTAIFGTIAQISLPIGGEGYSIAPEVVVRNENIAALGIGEQYLTLQSDDDHWGTGNVSFVRLDTNDRVLQANSGASGDVKGGLGSAIVGLTEHSNGTFEMTVRVWQDFNQRDPGNVFYANNQFVDLALYNSSYVPGEEDNRTPVGYGTAKIVSIQDEGVLGKNATITASVGSNGTITGLRVLDSGFSYTQNELVTLEAADHPLASSATARLRLIGVANSEGYYASTRSHISSQRGYIQDGDYYQEFSYEVISSIALKRFRDVVLKLVHPAGQALFGRYRMLGESNNVIEASSNNVVLRKASGTLAINSGSRNVTGTGTTFTTIVSNGAFLIVEKSHGTYYNLPINKVISNTSANLTISWANSSISSANVYYYYG